MRLFDADALLEKIFIQTKKAEFAKWLNTMPIIEERTQCIECKYYDADDDDASYGWCTQWKGDCRSNDFCSYAVKWRKG